MKQKNFRDFIVENRKVIDTYIKNLVPNIRPLNDDDRRDWILNDEGLYLWAKSEGVRV